MKGNNKYYIAGLVVMTLIIGVLLYLLIVKDNNNVLKDDKKTAIEINKEKEDNYLKTVPFYNSTVMGEAADAYYGKEATNDSISKEVLGFVVIENIKAREFSEEDKPKYDMDCGETPVCPGDAYYHKDDVDKKLKEFYNQTSLRIESIGLAGGRATFHDPYYVTFYGAGASSVKKINEVKSVNKTESGDIIIEEVACFLNYGAWLEGNFYNSTNFNEPVITKFSFEDYSEEEKMFKDAEEYFNQNKSKCKTFTHTFKSRTDGNPYWFSTKVNS